MSRFGGQSEERPSVFKTPSKLGTHLSTNAAGMKRRVDIVSPLIEPKTCGVEERYTTTRPYSIGSKIDNKLYEVCKLSNETGSVVFDLATLGKRDMKGSPLIRTTRVLVTFPLSEIEESLQGTSFWDTGKHSNGCNRPAEGYSNIRVPPVL
ncbi:hypothetical protein TNCV_668951 [Trichonephila clavipes]|nr:hypothetical protein TNCV_668951 [Trichonephila clavipes]